MEKYPKNFLYAACPSRIYGCGRRPPGASMPPNLAPAASHKRESVVAVANARHASPGCAPLTDGAAAGTWRGETDASGLHGCGLSLALARMLLQSVPMGRPNTTGWRGPLFKACSWKVKGQDLVVNRSRLKQDRGPRGVAMPLEHPTGPSYMSYGVVACPKRRHASPGCGPPHGRQ